jgi:4-hydroxy-3-polyprenylbenzoate decarboxylase
MSYFSLKEFVQKLENEGELVRIKEPVSPILEIPEITDRVSKSLNGGKALLFENVEGSEIPVLINAFGSYKRMQLALEVTDLDDIAKEIERFVKITPPTGMIDKIKMLPMLLEASQFPPRMTSSAPCQEVVLTGDAVDLSKLPILQCWPNDAGRFITFPMVINRDADRKIRNVGLYRMQVFDNKTTAMHWHIHKDGAHFFHEFKKRNQKMEVAIAIGADPASCYSASAPLPYGIDEFLLSGFLRKSPVPLVKCKTIDLEVPASAEIILEGIIDPNEKRVEGPFGDHTGYYSQDGEYPIFRLTAITHRKDPIYLTTIVGIPPQEDFYLGKATERIFLPLMRLHLPEIVDMDMPLEGVFHNCVIVSIDKRYPMQARRLMSALWSMGQMSFVKTIMVVDSKINVSDHEKILDLLLERFFQKNNLFFSEGILDVLNHSSDQALYGSKVGFDATDKVEGELGFGNKPAADSLETISFDSDLAQKTFQQINRFSLVRRKNGISILLAALDKTKPGQSADFIKSFFEHDNYQNINFLIVLEGSVDLENTSRVLWKFFANLDPQRDFHFFGNRVGIDVTQKYHEEGYTQDWPEEIEMSSEIKQRVDEKWNRFFPSTT